MRYPSTLGWLLILLACLCGAVAADTPGWDPGPGIVGDLCIFTPRQSCYGGPIYTNEQIPISSTGYDYDCNGDPIANDGTHCTLTYRKAGDTQEILMGKIKGDIYNENLCPCTDYAANPLVYSWRMPGQYIIKAVWDDHHVYANDPPVEHEYEVTIIHDPNSGIHFTYDVNGNRATVRDQRGTTTYGQDRLMRLKRVTEPDTGYIEYAYNRQDQRTSMRDHFAGTTAYTYDAHGQPYQITDRNSGVTEYAYYPNGALHTMAYPNGAYAVYTYNERDWLTDLTHRKANNALIAQFIYEYDPTSWGKNGTRTGMSEEILTPDNTTSIRADITYTYDDAYRLTGEERIGYAPYNGTPYTYDKTYSYDLVGNRLTKVDGSTTTYYHYDYDYPGGLSANKLMDYGPSSTYGSTSNTLLAYDSAGNLTTETPPSSGPVTGYESNWENMLTRVTSGGTEIAQFGYDGVGRRRSATFGTNTTGYLYDSSWLVEETNGEGNLAAFYTRGLPGVQSRQQGEDIRYYHGDAIGSVKAVTDTQAAVNVSDTYDYDAWGNLVAHLGSTTQPYQYVGQLGYYTHYQDANLDLLQLGVRFYDSALGRFTQVDPAFAAYQYRYAANDPLRFVDPTGLIHMPAYNFPDDFHRLPIEPTGDCVERAKRAYDRCVREHQDNRDGTAALCAVACAIWSKNGWLFTKCMAGCVGAAEWAYQYDRKHDCDIPYENALNECRDCTMSQQ